MQAGLFNIGNDEAHLTLVPIGQIFRRFANRMAALQFAAIPAGLTGAIGEHAALANTLRGNHLIFH
jgi:hypothetical protein